MGNTLLDSERNVRSFESARGVPRLSVSLDSTDDGSIGKLDNRGELLRFRFGSVATSRQQGVIPVPLVPVKEQAVDEVWRANETVTLKELSDVQFAQSREFLAANLRVGISDCESLGQICLDAYIKLITLVREQGYPNLLRIWNFFPHINTGTGDQERYKRFCLGRSLAFEGLGYRNGQLPAGTAVGSRSEGPLSITLLASKTPGSMIENPRQTSAYNYPRKYGPRSPAFSRAVFVDSDSDARLLVSGTASIVGTKSQHLGDPKGQTEESIKNLRTLVEQVAATNGAESAPCGGYLRVYIRDARHTDTVRREIEARLGSEFEVLLLVGDMCRKDLLVEIEGSLRLRSQRYGP